MRPNLGFYVQTINDLVKETEKIGETMNPNYEEIRQALDKKKESELSPERLETIEASFKKGTDKYRLMLEQISMRQRKNKTKPLMKSLLQFSG